MSNYSEVDIMKHKERNADVVMMMYGSHLYHLNTPNSDIDYMGVYLNTLDELLSGKPVQTVSYSTGPKDAKNGAGDIDYKVISLHKFIEDAVKGDTATLDMLHGVNLESTSEIWKHLVENRCRFYSKDMKAYVGFVRTMAGKYGVKGVRLKDLTSAINRLKTFDPATKIGEVAEDLYKGEFVSWTTKENLSANQIDEFYLVNGRLYQSTLRVDQVIPLLEVVYDEYGHRAKLAEENDGMDWKALSHALRAGYQAVHIYEDGDFEYPLPETELILKTKLGKADYMTEISPALEDIVRRVETATEISDFPEVVDVEYWNEWVKSIYMNKIVVEIAGPTGPTSQTTGESKMNFEDTRFDIEATDMGEYQAVIANWVYDYLRTREFKNYASEKEMQDFFCENENRLIDKACHALYLPSTPQTGYLTLNIW